MTEIDIKDCAFCGSDNTEYIYKEIYLGLYHQYISCNKCNCHGPRGNSEEEAIQLWNKRITDNCTFFSF